MLPIIIEIINTRLLLSSSGSGSGSGLGDGSISGPSYPTTFKNCDSCQFKVIL